MVINDAIFSRENNETNGEVNSQSSLAFELHSLKNSSNVTSSMRTLLSYERCALGHILLLSSLNGIDKTKNSATGYNLEYIIHFRKRGTESKFISP